MIREVKFRGKLKGTYIGDDPQNNWFYGSLVKELSTGKTYILDVAHTDKGEARFNTLGLEVIPETVGQFTGLLDKNGKEIYEGDVIEAFYSFEKDYVVKFGEYTNEQQYESHRSGYGYYLEAINGEPESIRELSYDLEDTKIIGNIHD